MTEEPALTRGEPATLDDVARLAGVSPATASRVLGKSTRAVRPELREKVLDAAARLSYTANPHARALARSASDIVGLLVHDIADPYFSSIAAGVTRVAEEQGAIVVLGTTLRDPEREIEYAATLRAQRARAIVLVGSRTTDPGTTSRLAAELTAFRSAGGRVACVGQDGLNVPTVRPDNQAGADRLARALTGLGHRRFAVLCGPHDLVTARERLDGFRTGLAASGGTVRDVVEGAFTRDGGYASALELLRHGTDATCVFAVNDVMAVGAMAALRERSVGVPEELSVAGFDDIATLRDTIPALTTVRLPLEEMGEQAARLALTPNPADDDEPALLPVSGEVILRESTRRLV
ncbi:LacI family DNA-binding transcriptional regulator [Actinoallomurus iriomotensis]|uniref:LacI family transcriptional regulator n=1 Tax=Actinoallomurus iriomotensis TaxID=478107 RepID=A0A9W6RSR8_9ACTN|nr:LacI family DNA-binding transcriptional regulator [Actinoallomurus iriomotensis]GLY80894.1 LacI family transcriptional regulator [Actinoallomurus iriomotensis]